ncbi:MAG: inositol monophosphatase family protein, partial [Bacteroidota bacterium]
MQALSALLPTVKTIARAAGAVILEVYAASETVEVVTKSDDSPLTIADQRANQVICAGLAQLTPDCPIISEENKQLPYAERQHFTYAWVVDPL